MTHCVAHWVAHWLAMRSLVCAHPLRVSDVFSHWVVYWVMKRCFLGGTRAGWGEIALTDELSLSSLFRLFMAAGAVLDGVDVRSV